MLKNENLDISIDFEIIKLGTKLVIIKKGEEFLMLTKKVIKTRNGIEISRWTTIWGQFDF